MTGRVERLIKKLDSGLIALGTHAAVPVALDPPFVHLLRTNFFLDGREALPFSAEWRLLLSPLCHEIGDGMYEIAPEIRRVLLERMHREYGPQRVRDVATLLWRYAERSPWTDRAELERAQQLAALGWIDPHRARAWLEDTQPATGDAVDRRWFVAMREEVGAIEQSAAPPAAPVAPAVDVAAFVTALRGLNYRAQEQHAVQEMRAHQERGFLVHGPPAHGQWWLMERLIGAIPRGLASTPPLVIRVPLDRDVAEHGIARVGEVLAARLGVAPGDDRSGSYRAWDLAMRAIGAERRRRVVNVILDGVERLDAGAIPGLTSYFWAHAASEESSHKAPASLLPLFLFLVDYRGATGAAGGVFGSGQLAAMMHNIVRLPEIVRFTHDDLVWWVSAYARDLPRDFTESPMRTAGEILANSDGGVPERAFEYLCWRTGVAWSEVLQRVESERDRDRADAGPAQAALGELAALAREYDTGEFDDVQTRTVPDERDDAMRDLMVRMRGAAAVDSRVVSSLAQSSRPGDRLAAIAVLLERPNVEWLSWLADRLRPGQRPYSDPAKGESPFLGIQAALAIDQAARLLPDLEAVRAAIDTARARLGPGLEPSDRFEALDWAEVSLGVRIGRWGDQYSPLAQEYDKLRRFEPSGPDRTEKMTRIAEQMARQAEPSPPMMATLMSSPSAGMRLQAIVALYARPTALHLAWLADRPGVEKWFIGYWACSALVRAANVLDAHEHDHLGEVLERAREGQRQSGDPQQAALLDRAMKELKRTRRSPSTEQTRPPASTPVQRAHASPLKNIWTPGSVLRVKFLDGPPEAQEFVRSTTAEWTRHANVRFDWNGPESPDEAEVRVSLKEDGAWAYLGTDALNVAQEQPTVELGYIAHGRMSDEVRRQAVLRTFGHVLGLLNEHQNPHANLPWNREAVYRDLDGPLNNWDRRAVEVNLLTPADARQYPWYREFDPASVMMPELSQHWFTTPLNYGPRQGLSSSDRTFIARLYPPSGVYDDAIRNAIESGRGAPRPAPSAPGPSAAKRAAKKSGKTNAKKA